MKHQQCRDNETAVKRKRPKRYIRILLTVTIVIFLCLLLWNYLCRQSVDEQLAAIEATRAIPDTENAAVYYRRFFSDPDNALILEDLSSRTPSGIRKPWNDGEFPELAALLEKHQQFIQTLLEISEMQEARFQIYPDPLSDYYNMSLEMRKVTFVFSWAAANDLAEGRIDEALRKHRSQIRLAYHLEQQPASFYTFIGIAIKAVGFNNIRAAVMQEDITQEQLDSIEAIIAISKSYSEPDPQLVEKLERLVGIKQRSTLSPIARLRAWWQAMRNKNTWIERMHLQQTRSISILRGTEILIALRRYKYKTGHWPQSLDEIKSMVGVNTLVDPTNNDSYVYKLTDDGFLLYSIGENNIDEGGQSLYAPDDIAIWPLEIPQTVKKSAVKK